MDETKNVNDMSTSGSETEQRENYGQPHFAYFQNSRCEYFPCHQTNKTEDFNCLKTVFSIAFSATVRCMHWAINAAGISNSLRAA